MNLFLEHPNININIKNDTGRSALLLACANGCDDVAEQLGKYVE